MKITNGKSMIKKITLITCAILLGLSGSIFLSLITGTSILGGVANIFLVFPLSVFYLYVCYSPASRLHRKRYLIGLAIVIANIFPVINNGLGTTIAMPWHFFEPYRDPRGLIIMFVPLILGFALLESGGWCYRKARVGNPSSKARVAVKGVALFLVNAMNLTMLAALAGLISKGDTPWSYGAFGLSFLAIGTLLLALFIWFRPTWRWWIAMLPSIVIFYVMPFWLTTYLNDRGEIESPWNKADDRGTIEAPRRSP